MPSFSAFSFFFFSPSWSEVKLTVTSLTSLSFFLKVDHNEIERRFGCFPRDTEFCSNDFFGDVRIKSGLVEIVVEFPGELSSVLVRGECGGEVPVPSPAVPVDLLIAVVATVMFVPEVGTAKVVEAGKSGAPDVNSDGKAGRELRLVRTFLLLSLSLEWERPNIRLISLKARTYLISLEDLSNLSQLLPGPVPQ